MRLGILTGGGDCPGLNAVIRAVVKTSSRYNLKVIGFRDGYAGLIHNRSLLLDLKRVSGIMPRGGTILGTSNRDNPFNYSYVKNNKHFIADVSERAVNTLEKNKISALIVVGGDGTLSIAYKFYQKGISVVGIPKTIDNDLSATELTFGFDTAVSIATEAIDRIHTTAESHHRIMIVEVMGRNAGWIALHSGMAAGAHLILIPEIKFKLEKILKKIAERKTQGKHFSILVVAEGTKWKNELVIKRKIDNQDNPQLLGGIGYKLGEIIENSTGTETRVTILGHIQRGGTPSAFDRILATRFGTNAVELVRKKDFGKMVCLKKQNIGVVSLKKAIGKLRTVSPRCSYVKDARLVGISFGD